MDSYQQVGAQLRAFLEAFMGHAADSGAPTRAGSSAGAEGEARRRRQNPLRVPDSRHYAAVLAYGNFILTEGMNIRCEAIQGLSGVRTLPQVATQANGHPEVQLERYLTHFYFADPSVVIEQNPHKRSTGFLRGATRGGAEALLPGRASFSQFLILQLDGKPLANREPLVMTAERVEEWPPIGSAFVSERPTEFFEMEKLDDPKARPFATLAACKAITVAELTVPER